MLIIKVGLKILVSNLSGLHPLYLYQFQSMSNITQLKNNFVTKASFVLGVFW